MNGIRYVLRYGIPWDAMPKDLPPSSICYDYWRLLTDGGHMEQINHRLVMMDREKAGREASRHWRSSTPNRSSATLRVENVATMLARKCLDASAILQLTATGACWQ